MNDAADIPEAKRDDPPQGGAGWRTTNSHPAKCSNRVPPEGIVLASGFDNLYLTLSLQWRERTFFQLLESVKEEAMQQEAPIPAVLESVDGREPWMFTVAPYGSEGYSWLLWSTDYFIKLTGAMAPSSRPNAMVEIRSEAMWRLGPLQAVSNVITFFESAGAFVHTPRVSRVDPCLDILIRKKDWDPGLQRQAVTYALYRATHNSGRKLSGLSIGRGKLMARLYDKVREIETKSKKVWMYSIWKRDVPPRSRAIRVEFQVRREALRELAIDTVWQLFNHPGALWRYLTEQWLKFHVDVDKDYRFQKPLPWWRTVQLEFMGLQPEHPLVRSEAVSADRRRVAQQLFGQLTSLVAIDDDTGDVTPERTIPLDDHVKKVKEAAELLNLDEKKLGKTVVRKLVRFTRRVEKMLDAEEERKQRGFPLQRRMRRTSSQAS